jgi:hypothetical protein
MSAPGLGQRVAVFALFAALAAGTAALFVPSGPAAAPSGAELAAWEGQLAKGARLHPASAPQSPVGPAAWCAECHPGLAHPGAGVAAAMLNEHASRMDCLLCHWPAAAGPRPAPLWQVQAGAAAFLGVLPRERAAPEQLKALRATAMAGGRCFARGPACVGCHRPGSIGPLLRPGAAPARVAALERLENHFTLAPGEKWYFPQTR